MYRSRLGEFDFTERKASVRPLMRLLRVLVLTTAATAACMLLVFVPVVLAIDTALRWNVGRVQQSQPCPPIQTKSPQKDNRLGGEQRTDSFVLGTLADDQQALTALAQCGDWVQIAESPMQWLHLATRRTVTVSPGEPLSATPAAAR